MKFIRFLGFLLLFVPGVSFAASSPAFQNASQLLAAARRGDTQTVQILINSGADVNYVDSTGLSLVCTAVMNNDTRAIQVLQMYGADASKCDRQIKSYKQKARVAARGEEYSFFSGLSSSHILALSAVGVAAVIGGVALLTDAFDAKNNNVASSSGGSHSSSGGGSGSSSSGGTVWGLGTTPYGPAYLDVTTGNIDLNTNISANLANWDTRSNSALRVDDFNYLRDTVTVGDLKKSQAELDGLNPLLENYLLDMHGYDSFANGYMGQFTFRGDNSRAPELPKLNDADGLALQGRPVRVALITGNGINPYGSADSAKGIMYAVNNTTDSQTPIVDKYLNNTLTVNSSMTEYTETENTGFDLSGSGSAFNPFANINDTALAKIVAGWEADGRSDGDLYGFVPNGQLAIYRTGNGTVWNVIENATSGTSVGTFTDADSNGVLSAGDTLVLNGKSYAIKTALSQQTTDSTVEIGGTEYQLSANSQMFVGVCVSGCTDNIGVYVGTDGAWYVNSTGGNDIDSVYISDSGDVYDYKTKTTGSAFTNFHLMQQAVNTSDVIANVNVLPQSRQYPYLTVGVFTKAAELAGVSSDLKGYYTSQVTNNYGTYVYTLNNTVVNEAQGGVANNLFNGYNSSNPMIVMPAGDYLFKDAASGTIYYSTLDAIFENYAPMIYGSSLEHSFMTVVGVSHENGTASAETIAEYGNGTGSAYGKFQLSLWVDSNNDVYSSRKCGLTGVGGSSVDPWCFAASGPTAEMATASAAGAVAAVKSAFSYMSTDQIFILLALTADGPYLRTDTNGSSFTTGTLVTYLKSLYELPLEYNTSSMSDVEYLTAFKDVFGYGLINLERAIEPGYSVYYYSQGNIVSTDGKSSYWGKAPSSVARSSTVLGGRGAIRTSFFDVVESADGSLSLPRVWNTTVSLGNDSRHGLYMGDVLADFSVDSTNKHTNKVGNMTFDMTLSSRAYADNMNGLDNLRVALNSENYDLEANYQHYLTDGESRFSGRANGVLSLVANSVSSGAKYKAGNFAFGARAFSGTVTDENLLENDPVISAQFEPGRLGFANGGAMDVSYNNDKFGFGVSFGNMHETNTVLGSVSEGLLSLNGADTQYVDAVANYKPFEKVNLSARATFANTRANVGDGIISDLSDIKSNAFALGADAYGFSFTAAMPLAAVDGRMGYDYADLSVVENDGGYAVVVDNAHVEYIDLAAQKRELRFSGSYRKSLGEFTDAGLGFVYRVNPSNTDVFGNESILMFKLHHRLGI